MEKQYGQFFFGLNRGENDQQGYTDLQNCEVFDEVGALTCTDATEVESSLPNEHCVSEVVSNGDKFFFSTSTGKVWKRTSGGVFSLVHTNTQGGTVGCGLWQGRLYYATPTKLGYITETNASAQSTWSSQNDSWQTFSRGGVHKPMHTIGSGLYIGDGYYVAAVDKDHVFIADALDLPSLFTITALSDTSNDLLIGTIIGNNVGWCKVFVWDRLSPAYHLEDTVPEPGINTWLKVDNINIAQYGKKGAFGYWNGRQMVKMKQIKGVTTDVAPYNTTEFQGRAYFANNNRVYSFHREDGDFPYAIVPEFTVAGTIKSIIGGVNDIHISDGLGISHKSSSKATAVIETPKANGSANKVTVHYYDLPEGTSIEVETSVNNGTYQIQEVTPDTINRVVYTEGGFGDCSDIKVKVRLVPSGSNTPKIKVIEIS